MVSLWRRQYAHGFMKRKVVISVIVAVAAIGAAAVTSAVIKRNSNTILNQNVEALMDVELITGGTFIVTVYSDYHWLCEQGGTFYCPMP